MKRILAALFMVLWIGFSIQLKAAPLLTAPADLAPGSPFRFIFVTSSTTQAISTSISTYNSFVQTQASGATFSGATVNWYAVGSAGGVSARDNVGGFGTSVPVYLVTGIRVADSLKTTSGGLWSGTILAAVNVGVDGSAATGTQNVWTGTNTAGASSVLSLGTTLPYFGDRISTNSNWIFRINTNKTSFYKMYAVSEELVAPAPASASSAVPTLSEWSQLLLGLIMMATLGWYFHKREEL